MGNKYLPKAEINAAALLKEMEENGYSVYSISKKISRSERLIRHYLQCGEMPEGMLKEIDDVLHPKTKTIWMRIGVTVPVTDDELFDLMERAHQGYVDYFGEERRADGMDDLDMTDVEVRPYLARATADGESYIPDVCFDKHLDWYLAEKERRRGSDEKERNNP